MHDSKFDRFEVVEAVEVDVFGSSVTLPKGFVTNGPSIPRLFWPFFPPHGRTFEASVVHDYLYDSRTFQDTLGRDVARSIADLLYKIHLRESGVSNAQVYIFFIILRIFGKKHWVN